MARNVIKARPFDYPDNGHLDPASTALLVIDHADRFPVAGRLSREQGL